MRGKGWTPGFRAMALLWAFGAAAAARADMLAVNWAASSDLSSLRLADGQWEFERDWYQARISDGSVSTVAFESWIDEGPVVFDIFGYSDGEEAGYLKVHITKSIENATDDVWEGFQIDVAPLYPIDWVEVVPESVTFTVFESAEVINAADGSAGITLDATGGEGMMPGGIASVSFDILLPNAIFTPFEITQYPVPEPAMALPALLALRACVRRRRAA